MFARALFTLTAAGAVLVEIPKFPTDGDLGMLEHQVLMSELKADLSAYLATTSPDRVPSRTLADLIAFNRTHALEEMPFFGQELFLEAEATEGLTDPAYLKALEAAHAMAGPQGVDKMLLDNQVSVLIAPTLGPAWLIDPINKDRSVGGGAGQIAAVSGYPHLTVPMGAVDGLPVGLSFIGPAWSEASLLAYGYAYEKAAQARVRPAYLSTAPLVSEGQWRRLPEPSAPSSSR